MSRAGGCFGRSVMWADLVVWVFTWFEVGFGGAGIMRVCMGGLCVPVVLGALDVLGFETYCVCCL